MEALPLFERSTRRALLLRGLGASGALAAGVVLTACGNGDKGTFSSTSTTKQDPTTTAAKPATSAAQATTATTATTATAASAPVALTVSFSYAATATFGRVRNPYIAAWIEDDTKSLAALISVWYSTREAKYLRELTEFAAVVANVTTEQADAVSGPTREAGAYELQWNGLGLDGKPLTGAYTLWIEAAREHGPHSVMSGPVVLGKSGSSSLTGNGELSDAQVTVV